MDIIFQHDVQPNRKTFADLYPKDVFTWGGDPENKQYAVYVKISAGQIYCISTNQLFDQMNCRNWSSREVTELKATLKVERAK